MLKHIGQSDNRLSNKLSQIDKNVLPVSVALYLRGHSAGDVDVLTVGASAN